MGRKVLFGMYHTLWIYEYTDCIQLLTEIRLNGADFSVVVLQGMFIHKYIAETSTILSLKVTAHVQSELTF